MIIYSAYEDPRPDNCVAEKAGIPTVILPYTVGGTDAARGIFGLFEDTVQRLFAGLASGRRP